MPLRETLAAGILRRSGWDGASPLIDPCCGAGTIAIEEKSRASFLGGAAARSIHVDAAAHTAVPQHDSCAELSRS